MMDIDEDIADLTSWLGKPPEKARETRSIEALRPSHLPDSATVQNGAENDQYSSDSDSDLSEIEFRPAKSTSQLHGQMPSPLSVRSASGGESKSRGPRSQKGPRVVVPVLDERAKEQYEYLPGHFNVKKVLIKSGRHSYTVKLESAEIVKIGRAALEDLDNGKDALEAFEKKSRLSGQFDSIAVDISDDQSEDEISSIHKVRRRPRHEVSSDGSEPSNVTDPSDEEPTGRRSKRLARNRLKAIDPQIDAFTDDEPDLDNDGKSTSASEPAGRRSSRLASNRHKASYAPATIELTDSDEGTLRLRRQGRGSRRSAIKGRQTPDTVPTRRSERTRMKPRSSMREKQEDEISSHSEEEVGPKIVTTKEVFPRIPEDDPFRLRHRQDCEVCGLEGYSSQKGHLVYCQGCTACYHKVCLGFRGTRDHLATKIGDEHFVLQCRRCIGIAHAKDNVAPHQGYCTVCKRPGVNSKPLKHRLTTRQEQLQREENGGYDPVTVVDSSRINNVDNVLFRCSTCSRSWHMHHLPQRFPGQSQLEDDDEGLPSEIELAQRRFDSYRRSWRCKDCIDNPRAIDVLVAWRPVEQETYIPGMTVDLVGESEKEYLIKWKSQSYLRATWMPGSWVWSVTAQNMRAAYMKRHENALPKMTTEDAMPEDFFRIDIVFDVKYNSVVRNSSKGIDFARIKEVETAFVKYKGLGYEDAIWEVPPVYTEVERFEDFRRAYEDYVTKVYMNNPSQSTLRRRMIEIRTHDFAQWSKTEQPTILSGGSLMPYQLDGMNWLYYQWFRNQNAILADEMGLGKTIQLIAFFSTLIQEHKCWPFLVVVPNSTCPNWRREIKKWAPTLRAVTYYGSERARKLTHDFELFPKDKEKQDQDASQKKSRSELKDIKAHIVIASYESIVEEKTRQSLMRVPWQGLVVDEGQRLKSDKTLIYEQLSKFRLPFKVLLTGTPLQNSARELFNLIQFLDRTHSAADLEAKFSELTPETVPELHELLRPFFLRRTKVQVLTFLPPMAQIIVPVSMSTVQKKVYKSILAANPLLMKSIFSREGLAQKDRANLTNILMQLRKTLCHPFVYSRGIEERVADNEIAHRNLVEASAKLQLLQIMLPKLQERGHRVLLFSQFLDNLDIIEDFLDGLGMLHHRLDGTINASEKQKRIDEFNAPNSPYFAFLLSTRAGGVGINLATADTVIILDPDFNPHQDIQALSRAHRIGQQNKVLVFQLMTRNSAEEKIMQIGKKKMALDHVLIERMAQEDDAGENLESILKFGAQSLFEDTEDHDIVYDSASVDKLLDRSQLESTKTSDDQSAESQFSFARIWANDTGVLEDTLESTNETGLNTPDPGIWDKILEEREKAYQEELARKEETLGRGKRKREKIDYHDEGFRKLTKRNLEDESTDGDFEADEPNVAQSSTSEESGESRENESDLEKMPTVRVRPFKRIKIPSGEAPHFNGDGPSNYNTMGGLPPIHHCGICDENHPIGWCRLKLAGVEHCGLCGLAHMGHGRTCPHLNDEKQIETLLATLKESTESRETIEEATRYLRLIRSDLITRRRDREKKDAEAANRARMSSSLSAGPGQPVRFNHVATTANWVHNQVNDRTYDPNLDGRTAGSQEIPSYMNSILAFSEKTRRLLG